MSSPPRTTGTGATFTNLTATPPAQPALPALLLAAHGGGDGSRLNRDLLILAAEVQERWGAPVEVAHVRGTPTFDEWARRRRWSRRSLAGASGGAQRGLDTLVLPLFLAEGYFVRRRLHPALGVPGRDAAQVGSDTIGSGSWLTDDGLAVAPPLGDLEEVQGRFVQRVARAAGELARPGAGSPSRRTEILVVAHGTRRDPRSADTGLRVAGRLLHRLSRSRSDAGRRAVRPCFLDQDPSLEGAVAALPRGTDRVLVAPWLWGGAGHCQIDIPAALRGVRDAEVDILPPVREVEGRAEVLVEISTGLQRTLAREHPLLGVGA